MKALIVGVTAGAVLTIVVSWVAYRSHIDYQHALANLRTETRTLPGEVGSVGPALVCHGYQILADLASSNSAAASMIAEPTREELASTASKRRTARQISAAISVGLAKPLWIGKEQMAADFKDACGNEREYAKFISENYSRCRDIRVGDVLEQYRHWNSDESRWELGPDRQDQKGQHWRVTELPRMKMEPPLGPEFQITVQLVQGEYHHYDGSREGPGLMNGFFSSVVYKEAHPGSFLQFCDEFRKVQ